MIRTFTIAQIILFLFINSVFAEKVNKIVVSGNERISKETLLMFGRVNLEDDLNNNDLNIIIKNLYETNFFKDIKIDLNNNILKIEIVENPIIQLIKINGIKAKKVKEPILESLNLKNNNSFIEYLAKKDKNLIINLLKNSGYYFADVKLSIANNSNNTVTLIYDVELGEKSKIRKIKFIGDKKFKNRKLYNVIVSEEAKFWKFLSSRKLLNRERIDLDTRLLQSYYKNKGYYNVKIENSFAQFLDVNQFDLIFKINAGEKFYFNNLKLELPVDYNREHFAKIDSTMLNLKEKPYSFNRIEKILDTIEEIALTDQYESITATVQENIIDNNKIDFFITVDELKKEYIERINIVGNNVTREEVFRNALILDEGDAFNEILHNKSINNLKSLNFFSKIETKVSQGSSPNNKIINIEVEEKPTGEIVAGAGFGTSGTTIGFGVKENNFLGRGVQFASNIELSEESIRGAFSVINPNWRGTDQTLIAEIQSVETDRMTDFGYKTTSTGFNFGSRFEYYEDFFITPSLTTSYETLKTASTASTTLQKQRGTYFDADFNYVLDYDKRNQKFQTSEGFRSRFDQSLPVLSETNSIINAYEFNVYHELNDETIGSFTFYSKAINSITGDNVRISERLYMPSSKLRGFERGKIGPVDSGDFVGGNYVSSVNFAATLPNAVPTIQNADFSIFLDAGNVWGVDYDSSVNDTNKIRSSAGVAVDWFTPIGPLSFSYTTVISKASTDKTESFRFNLGTTF